MKNLILKWKIKRYLKHAVKMHKLRSEIDSLSDIALSFNDTRGNVQVCGGYYNFFNLIKPRHGDFVPFSASFKYKHIFKYRNIELFYLTGGSEID